MWRPHLTKLNSPERPYFCCRPLGTIFFIAAAIVAVKYEDSVMVKNPIVEAGQIDFDKYMDDLLTALSNAKTNS